MNRVIGGHVVAFKGDDEKRDSSALVEVCDFTKEGFVEVAFDHRGERVYLKFPLPELLAMVAREHGSEA